MSIFDELMRRAGLHTYRKLPQRYQKFNGAMNTLERVSDIAVPTILAGLWAETLCPNQTAHFMHNHGQNFLEHLAREQLGGDYVDRVHSGTTTDHGRTPGG